MRGLGLGALLASLLPAAAAACPVCFGKTVDNAGFIRGLTLGISVLLAFTFAILGTLAWTFVRIERGRAAAEGLAAR